ncbi:MAG: hypothetical protein QM760_16325 [Nibricoccus sp.]
MSTSGRMYRENAPNAVREETGNVNYIIDPSRTGQHLYRFTLQEPVNLAAGWAMTWQGGKSVPLRPGAIIFIQLESKVSLGGAPRAVRDGFSDFRAAGEAGGVCFVF